MSKFRLRVKLQGFELEVDGEREDIPAITSAVKEQLAGLIQPVESVVDGNRQLGTSNGSVIEGETRAKSRGVTKKRPTKPIGSDSAESQVIEFRHVSEKFGMPKQEWSVAQKCVWLLFVLHESQISQDATASQLTATFNTKFREAKTLHPPNVTRDLAKAKGANPSPLGEHQGKWYLTTEGKRQGQELVQQCLGPNN